MGKPVPDAFTLIELLVVIAITAVIGIYTLANYRSFGEDQNLKNAVLDIQSLLRTAQTNATANVKCNTLFSATWQVEFADAKTINLNCLESTNSFTKKILKLDEKDPNIQIDSISGNPPTVSCPGAPPFSSPFPTTSFAPLTGKATLGSTSCTSLTITVKNNKTGNIKSLTVEQGGRIYGQ